MRSSELRRKTEFRDKFMEACKFVPSPRPPGSRGSEESGLRADNAIGERTDLMSATKLTEALKRNGFDIQIVFSSDPKLQLVNIPEIVTNFNLLKRQVWS
jgi:hypothetical protein